AHQASPEHRAGQRTLAREVTAVVHGSVAAAAAEAASEVLFGSSLEGVDAATLETVAAEVPATTLSAAALAGGLDLVEVLATTGLASSKGDARRLLAAGGVSVNNERAA